MGNDEGQAQAIASRLHPLVGGILPQSLFKHSLQVKGSLVSARRLSRTMFSFTGVPQTTHLRVIHFFGSFSCASAHLSFACPIAKLLFQLACDLGSILGPHVCNLDDGRDGYTVCWTSQVNESPQSRDDPSDWPGKHTDETCQRGVSRE